MGSFEEFEDAEPFEDKIRRLTEEDLLEIWEESQELETMLNIQAPGHGFPGASFEQAIVRELALRTTLKLAGGRP